MCEVGRELGADQCPICGGIVTFGLPYETTLQEVAIPLLKGCGHVVSVTNDNGKWSAGFEEKE